MHSKFWEEVEKGQRRVTSQTTSQIHVRQLLHLLNLLKRMAGTTRLELATSAVTGQRSNQLNYVPAAYRTEVRQVSAGCAPCFCHKCERKRNTAEKSIAWRWRLPQDGAKERSDVC